MVIINPPLLASLTGWLVDQVIVHRSARRHLMGENQACPRSPPLARSSTFPSLILMTIFLTFFSSFCQVLLGLYKQCTTNFPVDKKALAAAAAKLLYQHKSDTEKLFPRNHGWHIFFLTILN